MLNTPNGFYVLFEKADSHDSENINNYDCMGYTETENIAIEWRNSNIDSRTYKYCSNININNNIDA